MTTPSERTPTERPSAVQQLGTVLNVVLRPEVVHICTDTLMIRPVTKEPGSFTTKFFLVPHMQGVICATGAYPVLMEWVSRVQQQILVPDVAHLDAFAAEHLREIAHDVGERFGHDPVTLRTTVYHFGFCRDRGRMLGFGYASENDFTTKQYDDCAFYKPSVDPLPPAPPEGDGVREWFIDLAGRQRDFDDQKPVESRVGIGGELHHVAVTRDVSLVQRIHRFDDYERDFQTAMQIPERQP